MDIYDESMVFLEEVIEDNEEEVGDLLNKQNNIGIFQYTYKESIRRTRKYFKMVKK